MEACFVLTVDSSLVVFFLSGELLHVCLRVSVCCFAL